MDALLTHERQFATTRVIAADDDGTQAAAFRERAERKARTHGRIGGVGLGEAFRLMDPAS